MPVAGTVLLIDLLFGEKGAVNGLFAALNLPIVEWLNGKYAFWVMILMYLWKNTGYSVILLLAGLVTVPAEQYESADLDGASAFQKFRYITFAIIDDHNAHRPHNPEGNYRPFFAEFKDGASALPL